MNRSDVQDPADELAIRRLIVSGWGALDRKDWDAYAAAFADDGEFEIFGQRRRGRAEIVAGRARDLAKYDALQHLVMNELVEVDGDEASGRWYAVAIHVPDATRPAEHADVGLRYTFRARRAADGWRFAEVRLEPLWTAGLSVVIEDPPES